MYIINRDRLKHVVLKMYQSINTLDNPIKHRFPICFLQTNTVTADTLVRWLQFSTMESSTVLSRGLCSANASPHGQQTASVGLPHQPQQ